MADPRWMSLPRCGLVRTKETTEKFRGRMLAGRVSSEADRWCGSLGVAMEGDHPQPAEGRWWGSALGSVRRHARRWDSDGSAQSVAASTPPPGAIAPSNGARAAGAGQRPGWPGCTASAANARTSSTRPGGNWRKPGRSAWSQILSFAASSATTPWPHPSRTPDRRISGGCWSTRPRDTGPGWLCGLRAPDGQNPPERTVFGCWACGAGIARDLNAARNLALLVAGRSPKTPQAGGVAGSGQENGLVRPATSKPESPGRKPPAHAPGNRVP